MKQFFKYFFSICIIVFFVFSAFTPITQAGDYGLTETKNKIVSGGLSTASLPEKIGTAIGAVLALVGLVFFILMIYGGILWMTAMGNETQVGNAKNIIIQATIGLVIVMSAYAITAYIGGALSPTK